MRFSRSTARACGSRAAIKPGSRRGGHAAMSAAAGPPGPPGPPSPPIHGTGPAAAATGGAHDCMPTFVSVSPDDRRLYVACNHGNTLQVLDAGTLELVREIAVGTGAYNVEPSADGRWIIVTNKKAQSVSLVDAQSLAEVAKIPTSKPLPHGIAYSPDGRWAFISQESVGIDPGAVDVIDLTTRARVATIPVPRQPTGITILQMP